MIRIKSTKELGSRSAFLNLGVVDLQKGLFYLKSFTE